MHRVAIAILLVASTLSPTASAREESRVGVVVFHHSEDGKDSRPERAAPTAVSSALYGIERTRKSERPLWHRGGCLQFSLNVESFGDDDVESAFFDATKAWSEAASSCGDFSVSIEATDYEISALDGHSTIVRRNDEWCRKPAPGEQRLCYPENVVAITRLYFIDDPSDPADGQILEADIEINGVDIAFGSGASELDLQSVLTHELGHAFGLTHNCSGPGEPSFRDLGGATLPICAELADDDPRRAATMYFDIGPGEQSARTLESGDALAVCSMASGVRCIENAVGGCGVGESGDSQGLWWLFVGLLVGAMRGRRGLAAGKRLSRANG